MRNAVEKIDVSIYPSGFLLAATRAGPIVAPAPGMFSTMMGWPRCFSVAAASARRVTSAEAPGDTGEINVTGRVGKSCAQPGLICKPAAAIPSIQLRRVSMSASCV